jgi:hypothetical protein
LNVEQLENRRESSLPNRSFAMRTMSHTKRISALLVAATFAASASAQSFVYPAKGQSEQQQKKDEGQCHTWAVKQSKYDPANPPKPAQTAQAPATATGTTPGAGARGAVRGAVVGEAVGGDARTGAAAGAVAARGQSRRPERGGIAAAATGCYATERCRNGCVSEGARGVPRRARLFREVAKAASSIRNETELRMPRHIVTLGFDFDAISGFIARGMTSPTPISRGEFGPVAVPRILALLNKYKISATWFIPGHTLETYPAQCRQIADARHEIGHHGWTHVPPNDLTREKEEEGLVRANEQIKKLTGRYARGYRSPAGTFRRTRSS